MATSQLTLFDLSNLPGRACHRPTKKYPDGRTGTTAGVAAHSTAKEKPCEECRAFAQKRGRDSYAKKREQVMHERRKQYLENPEKYASRLPVPAVVDPSLACFTPTLQYPFGRTGTYAGYQAHYGKGEVPCGACLETDRAKGSKYYWNNREKISEYKKGYMAKTREKRSKKWKEYYAENREEILERERQFRSENREMLAEYERKRYAENREDKLRKKREYALENPETVRSWIRKHRHRRRAAIRNLPADGYTQEDVTRTHGTVCYLCNTEVDITLPHGTPLSPEIDHVHPISRPGCPGDVLENAKWTHSACNLRKRAKLVSELALPFPPPQDAATDLPAPLAPAQ